MAETQTPNYKWVLPDLGGDASTWGSVLNQTITAIDAAVWANQGNLGLGQVPIGVALDFFGVIIPTNYLPCDGSTHNVSDWPILGGMLAIGAATTFQTPMIGGKAVIGANATYALGTSGGSTTVTIDVTMLPAHAHPITDVQHNHVSPAHAHLQQPHAHTASAAGHSDAHAHGSNLMKFVGSGGSLGVGSTPFNVITVNTDGAASDVVIDSVTINPTTAVNVGTQAPINPTYSGLTTTQNSAAATGQVPVMQPWIAATKIIRGK